MWLKGHETLWVEAPQGNSAPAKFFGRTHFDIKVMMFQVCLVISQDHVVKKPYAALCVGAPNGK